MFYISPGAVLDIPVADKFAVQIIDGRGSIAKVESFKYFIVGRSFLDDGWFFGGLGCLLFWWSSAFLWQIFIISE